MTAATQNANFNVLVSHSNLKKKNQVLLKPNNGHSLSVSNFHAFVLDCFNFFIDRGRNFAVFLRKHSSPRVTTVLTYTVSRLRTHPIKDNNIRVIKLDHCDQELQYFYTAMLCSLGFVICMVNDINNCKLLQLQTNYHYVSVVWYSIYHVPTYAKIQDTLHCKNESTL